MKDPKSKPEEKAETPPAFVPPPQIASIDLAPLAPAVPQEAIKNVDVTRGAEGLLVLRIGETVSVMPKALARHLAEQILALK